jgi:hypothetical protein
MAFDFPNTPTIGDLYAPAGGPNYKWDGQKWKLYSDVSYATKTADTRNRLFNPAMQISQETAKGTSLGTNGGFACDMWKVGFVTSGVPAYACIADNTEDNAVGYIRLNNAGADAALGASDYYGTLHVLEGSMIEDFQWGSANADPAVLRFRARGSIAGTFAVSVRNHAGTRCWSKNFTIAQAGVWQEFSVAIPADTAGTWVEGGAPSMIVAFYIMLGSSFIGTEGWNTTVTNSVLGNPGMTNWMAGANQYIEITNVGLHRDPDNTGKAPPFRIPVLDEELRHVQRYLRWVDAIGFGFSGNVTASGSYTAFSQIVPPMRATPILSGASAAAVSFPAAIGSLTASPAGVFESRIANATGVGVWRSSIKLDARM